MTTEPLTAEHPAAKNVDVARCYRANLIDDMKELAKLLGVDEDDISTTRTLRVETSHLVEFIGNLEEALAHDLAKAGFRLDRKVARVERDDLGVTDFVQPSPMSGIIAALQALMTGTERPSNLIIVPGR